MMMQGNTILVAGGSRGIGRGLAELLCRLGNEVLVFDAQPGAAEALARANPGMRAVDLELGNPWSVAGFAEQVAAICPGLNMFVNIAIAFPVKHLPGLHALMDDDDSHEKIEAHRLGVQHLTGSLLPHLRKRGHSAVLNIAAGPKHGLPGAPRHEFETAAPACTLSVRKRWAQTSIEMVDVALPSRAERVSAAQTSRPQGVPRAEFVSSVAHLLAEGLHEAAALAQLRALWPAVQPAPRRTEDDDLVSEAW